MFDTLSLGKKDTKENTGVFLYIEKGIGTVKQGIHVAILLAFLSIAILMLMHFLQQLPYLFRSFDEHHMFSTFGDLLVLWTVMELVQAELLVLRGERFGISVLIDVALATIVRKVLVGDFHEGSSLIYDLASIFVLTIVRVLLIRKPNPAIDEKHHTEHSAL